MPSFKKQPMLFTAVLAAILSGCAGHQPAQIVPTNLVQSSTREIAQLSGTGSERVLYPFTSPRAGEPNSPFVFEKNGAILVTTIAGGNTGTSGTYLELTPTSSGYTMSSVHYFGLGGAPSGIVRDQFSNVFGLDFWGLFELTQTNGEWSKSLVHPCRIPGNSDRYRPSIGADGAVYFPCVYNVLRLSHASGKYVASVLYRFGTAHGVVNGDLVEDRSGRIFGTTNGEVFELSPAGSGYTERDLHIFQGGANDGSDAFSGVTMDASGTLYGTTVSGGASNNGTVYKVATSGSGYQVIDDLAGKNAFGALPLLDGSGSVYLTMAFTSGSTGNGALLKLTPTVPAGYTQHAVYAFKGAPNDGAVPSGVLIRDGAGNVIGTTIAGGKGSCIQESNGCGTIFEYAP